MQAQDLERIAKTALRELGIGAAPVTVMADSQPDRWRIVVGGSDPATLTIRAGSGTTPQFVREQIIDQFAGR